MEKATFPVLKMSCVMCARSIENKLSMLVGLSSYSVNVATRSLTVEYNPEQITVQELKKAVIDSGYDILVDSTDGSLEQIEKQQFHDLKMKVIISWVLSAVIMALSMMHIEGEWQNWVMLVLSLIVVLYCGASFYVGAIKQLKNKSSNMDTLVALSTFVALIFSAFNTIFPEFWTSKGVDSPIYYEAAVMIIAFVKLGKMIEEKAKNKTSSAIKGLMGLRVKTATLIVDGVEQEVLIETLNQYDKILVKPGESIPVDGMVVSGSTFVNESMISGEPIAVEKNRGDKLLAGTINQNGSVVFEATKVGDKTVLSQIIKMVESAQNSKAPVQRAVDRVSRVFVPVVVGFSVLTFVVWGIFGGEEYFSYGVLNSIAVLVIACPCALGLATPTALMVGIGRAAQGHILVKDAAALETMCKVNVVVMDKTGTITEGRPQISHIDWINVAEPLDYSALLSIEKKSEHPLSDAIVDFLKDKKIERVRVEVFENRPGRGVVAKLLDREYWVGNLALANGFSVSFSIETQNYIKIEQSKGHTVVLFGYGDKLLAVIVISDTVKPTSLVAIKKLQDNGIEVRMLTGDSEASAGHWAQELGIEHYVADVLPGQKQQYVQQLQGEGKVVAMVGDGINDSQALATADVSIAMGKGTDIAMDIAMVTLITSDLSKIYETIRLSKKTVRIVHENLFWAFVYNTIGIPIAAGVLFPVWGILLSPMWASAAMALSSVSVVLNSLRLRNK